MLGAESAVLILDDTEGVWPRHAANLLQVSSSICGICAPRCCNPGVLRTAHLGITSTSPEKRVESISGTVTAHEPPVKLVLPAAEQADCICHLC
jgi:hypothetical protein